MKLPRLVLGGMMSASAVVALSAAAWWWVIWPQQTMNAFVAAINERRWASAATLCQADGIAIANDELLVIGIQHKTNVLLLPKGWQSGIEPDHRSLLDVLMGRARFQHMVIIRGKIYFSD